MITIFRLLFTALALSVSPAVYAEESPPVKVFVLAGQSNMEGQAVVDLDGKDYNDGKGTLLQLLNDPNKKDALSHLRDASGAWAVRDDVVCRYKREHGPLLAGPLGVGFAVYGGTHHFGPELQFGHVVGNALENPVLIIKTAWGGKSLYQDFRPPSSGGAVGPYYQKMIADIHEALANFSNEFPQFAGRKQELAGFVWYHGWNDGVEPKTAVPEYEQNVVNLLLDVRKEFAVPHLPCVIGELTGPWVEAPGEWNDLRKAQQRASLRPELNGNVAFVPTHDFVRAAEDSPNPTHGHHEFGNAETYFLVGDALGKAMVGLLQPIAQQPLNAQDLSRQNLLRENLLRQDGDRKREDDRSQPMSRTEKKLQGWTVLVDDRLGDEVHRDLHDVSLRFLEAKLFDVAAIVPEPALSELRKVRIVLDLNCGKLQSMQYHPSAGWLTSNGYSADLEKCVHLPRAANLATPRNINEQPWFILHELAHAYHDQVLGFEEPRVKIAYERYKTGGQGEATLLFDGRRIRHYALNDQKEFFAEMTEAFFGVNDFYPFTRAELKDTEPALYELLDAIWTRD